MSALPSPVGMQSARARGARRADGALGLVGAVAASRILVLGAGAIGALALRAHDAAAANALRRLLGPVAYPLAGAVDRFDSAYYLAIAAHGYGALASGRVAFFPLYPLLIRALVPLCGSAVLAGAAISQLSFAGALVVLHRLCEHQLGRAAADATVLALAFAPLSFFFSAVYTESLFLLLSVASLEAARRDRWRLACGLAALAALARSVGVLLVVALVAGRIARGRRDRSLAWALAVPGALAGWLAALALAGYPPLSPFTIGARWDRVSTGPVIAVASAIWTALRSAIALARGAPVYSPSLAGPFSSAAEAIILLAVLGVCAAALCGCARHLPRGYVAYAALALAMVLSSPVATQPLESFDRYALTIFPLWMAGGRWLARRRRVVRLGLLVCGAAALAFYSAQFASWAFIA
ncbi:MAG TPA: mannosyltransferase family protein [Solirubrobacteraceae bacterium]|nr:mannosyltransferase family protein [Solirubrobacteraceae bacterium]